MNVFTMHREHSSSGLPVQVGLMTTNNGSYPHEETATVTGSGGNGSGAPRMRIGKDPDCTWVTGGEKEAKETKIQECQISGVRLTRPLIVLDTHLPEIFSAKLFSEFPTGKRRCHVSDMKITVFQITCHEVPCLEPNRLSHRMWLGIGRNSFPRFSFSSDPATRSSRCMRDAPRNA